MATTTATDDDDDNDDSDDDDDDGQRRTTNDEQRFGSCCCASWAVLCSDVGLEDVWTYHLTRLRLESRVVNLILRLESVRDWLGRSFIE